MEKKITIKIKQTTTTLISQWLIFIVGMLFVGSIFSAMLKVINSFEDVSIRMIALIVFAMTLTKIFDWVKFPTRYSVEECMDDVKAGRIETK